MAAPRAVKSFQVIYRSWKCKETDGSQNFAQNSLKNKDDGKNH